MPITTMFFSLAVLSALVVIYNRKSLYKKYSDFRSINRLVSSQHSDLIRILFYSLSIVFQLYWLRLIQFVNRTVEYTSKNTVIVNYVVDGKKYSFPSRLSKSPNSVIMVYDEDTRDVTDLVFPFMGPYYDWHGNEFTPKFWNRTSLTFELTNGESKTFDSMETITL